MLVSYGVCIIGCIGSDVLQFMCCTDSLGFAEVCIQCSLSVAVERNVRRPIPIPHSTIETMERVLELPDPSQHHWESRSIVAVNDHKQKEFILTTV